MESFTLKDNKPTDNQIWYIPEAVKDTPVRKHRSKKGNEYSTWTESWFKNAIRGGFRELFHQWPRRKEVLNRVRLVEETLTKKGVPSKRPSVWFICEKCQARCKQAKNAKGHPRIWVDHIEPVVPIGGDISIEGFLDRLFCNPSNLQALCDKCHTDKTNRERSERMRARKSGKTGATWRRD